MLTEVAEALAAVGLDIGTEKTRWTSHPARKNDHLKWNGMDIFFNGNHKLRTEVPSLT